MRDWEKAILADPIPPDVLREALADLGLTQEAFAQAVKVSVRAVKAWLSPPDYEHSRRLSGAQAFFVREFLFSQLGRHYRFFREDGVVFVLDLASPREAIRIAAHMGDVIKLERILTTETLLPGDGDSDAMVIPERAEVIWRKGK